MRGRLSIILAIGVLAWLAGMGLPSWSAHAGSLAEVRQTIQDLREIVTDLQKAINTTKRFSDQTKREVSNAFKQLQRGNINVSKLEQLIKNTDKALLNLDNARGEFSNLDDLRRQLEPLGDLAVLIVDLANRGLITRTVANGILRDLNQLAKQITNTEIDTNDSRARLQSANDLVNTAAAAMETALDNVDFGVSTTPSSILVDPSDLEPAREALRDADKALFQTNLRLERFKNRVRQINQLLSSIASRLPSSGDEEGGGTEEQAISQKTQTLGIFTLAGQRVSSEASSTGTYLVIERVRLPDGMRLAVRKIVISK
jgi:predicted  nucleic acid-binding Zn-ribbon protein